MTKHPSSILIGCAGWSLSSKVAAEFPTVGTHLERYAAVFSTVEINSSFYRSHQAKTYARWRNSVPENFRFSVKIPRTITHEHRLRDVELLLDQFLLEAGQLEEKLECLLLQLPPSLKFSPQETEEFFGLLRHKTKTAVACEPRHASWFASEADTLMRQYGVSFVHADPLPVVDIPRSGDSRTLYFRLHGSPNIYRSAYDDNFLDAVAAKIVGARDQTHRIFCIFDNTAEGAAIPDALSLMRRLEL